MADPQPITYTPIAYTPQYQPPIWRDNVDLVSAGTPNGFNAQFKNLKAEFDALKIVVLQLSNAISTLIQTMNSTQTIAIAATATADSANATAKTALDVANKASANANAAKTTADTAKATADAAKAAAEKFQPTTTLQFYNENGGITAWGEVRYMLNGADVMRKVDDMYKGGSREIEVPVGATNIRIKAAVSGGKTIYEKTASFPSTPAPTYVRKIAFTGITMFDADVRGIQ